MPKSGKYARCRAPSSQNQFLTAPPLPSPRPSPWQNPPRSPASNSAERFVASCRARNRPRVAETLAGVLFAGWLASSGTIAANPRPQRVATVASSRCAGSSSSNPSPCWRPLDTAVRRPHTRFCRRRSQTHRRGWGAKSAYLSRAMRSEELGDFPFPDLASSRLQHKINKFFVAGA